MTAFTSFMIGTSFHKANDLKEQSVQLSEQLEVLTGVIELKPQHLQICMSS